MHTELCFESGQLNRTEGAASNLIGRSAEVCKNIAFVDGRPVGAIDAAIAEVHPEDRQLCGVVLPTIAFEANCNDAACFRCSLMAVKR